MEVKGVLVSLEYEQVTELTSGKHVEQGPSRSQVIQHNYHVLIFGFIDSNTRSF